MNHFRYLKDCIIPSGLYTERFVTTLLDSPLHPDLTVSRKSCHKQPERINSQKEPVRAIISHVAEILQTEPNQKSSAIPPTYWLTLVLTLVTFKIQKQKTHNRIQILKGFQCQNFYFNPSPTNLQRTSVTTSSWVQSEFSQLHYRLLLQVWWMRLTINNYIRYYPY